MRCKIYEGIFHAEYIYHCSACSQLSLSPLPLCSFSGRNEARNEPPLIFGASTRLIYSIAVSEHLVNRRRYYATSNVLPFENMMDEFLKMWSIVSWNFWEQLPWHPVNMPLVQKSWGLFFRADVSLLWESISASTNDIWQALRLKTTKGGDFLAQEPQFKHLHICSSRNSKTDRCFWHTFEFR